MRLRYKAGAVDGATESSTHGRGQGHNDLLILSLPEADVSQQVVCPLALRQQVRGFHADMSSKQIVYYVTTPYFCST